MVVDEKWREHYELYDANDAYWNTKENLNAAETDEERFYRQMAELSYEDNNHFTRRSDEHPPAASSNNNAIAVLPAPVKSRKAKEGYLDYVLDTVIHYAWLPFIPVQRIITRYQSTINMIFAVLVGAAAAFFLMQQGYPIYALIPLVVVASAIGVNSAQIVYWILEFVAAIIAVSVLLSGLMGLLFVLYYLFFR